MIEHGCSGAKNYSSARRREWPGTKLEFMDGTQALLTVAALNLVAAMSPGPAFVLVTQIASSSTRRDAFAAAAGTVLASLMWAAAALLGMQAVLLKTASLYRLFQFAGDCTCASLDS